ncbi:DUF3530 family protein [Marinobacter sp. F4206]|uniref:DUF3530 family protein n=1 Tax=Marinobacter sp. F4206 TaxID=2861777 RepID=UPI001C60689D|nr:DUF3530 family protein [Marinobacter sp. F4206]MBW4934627.1 alpha/beta hydrolase family protein [Marinobacter sp. F4206]
MPRIASSVIKQLLLILTVPLWLDCSVASASETAAETPAREDSGANPGRSGFTTGLGEVELSQAFPDAALWLELEDDDRALGLFYPEREPPAEGALVLLADVGGNAASGVVGGLGLELVERGWAVLSVGLPAPSLPLQRSLEERLDNDDQAAGDGAGDDASAVMIDVMASPDGESPEQRYRGRVRQSLEAAVEALASRGYDRPVLLGVGRASGHLVAAQLALPNPGIMIWVAPEFYPRDALSLAESLSPRGTGILELYASRSAGSEDARRRWANLLRAGVETYERQPVSLQEPPSRQDAPALAGRIDAWLRSR